MEIGKNMKGGKVWIGIVLAACLILAGCSGGWQTTVVGLDGTEAIISRATWRDLEAFAGEDSDDTKDKSLLLERTLYEHGYSLIETLTLTDANGATRTFDWAAIAGNVRWQKNGTLTIDGETLRASRIEGSPPALAAAVTTSLADIAPTAAAALGLPAPSQATGHALTDARASHVLLIFLDGFGYVRYTEACHAGLIPTLSALGEPAIGLSVYPPSTAVASAVMLTGAPPATNGAALRGTRTTEAETLFDMAAQAGLNVIAVEGNALAFNLRNAEIMLSGDRDGNGSTDDNIHANALAALEAGMPDILWVHFHGIDDVGHTYGPNTPEDDAAIAYVDGAVGDILAAVSSDTLVLIFADHGMHAVQEEGRLGNHGNLIARDMLVPVWVVVK
ncbi:MAG: alkaline phosphatase family protein [Anaerolineae bacterium]|nr:alkaline phosphatase family protein [Anaerolineae bacterium]